MENRWSVVLGWAFRLLSVCYDYEDNDENMLKLLSVFQFRPIWFICLRCLAGIVEKYRDDNKTLYVKILAFKTNDKTAKKTPLYGAIPRSFIASNEQLWRPAELHGCWISND